MKGDFSEPIPFFPFSFIFVRGTCLFNKYILKCLSNNICKFNSKTSMMEWLTSGCGISLVQMLPLLFISSIDLGMMYIVPNLFLLKLVN